MTEGNPPRIETVAIVTPEHGEAFAEGWYNGDMAEAVHDTGIMTGPEGYYGDLIAEAAERHYLDLEGEICHLVFEATKQVIADAFVTAANAVISRERERGSTPPMPTERGEV